jgi:hypothetical protein
MRCDILSPRASGARHATRRRPGDQAGDYVLQLRYRVRR